MCPVLVKSATLQWYGYAVDGVGFHCLEMDETLFNTNVALPENAATVIINEIDPRSKLRCNCSVTTSRSWWKSTGTGR
jgi:hypothetical protein